MTAPIRFATIGSGWIAQDFMKTIQDTPGVVLTGIYSRSAQTAEKLAAQFGAPFAFSSMEELCACPQIDAVYIASPNSLHTAQTRQCLLAGKHVICEKPAAVTAQEIRFLQQLARQNGCIYLEAMMSVHLPQFATLSQLVSQLGRLSGVHLDLTQYSSKLDAYRRGELPNIFNPRFCTGALMDLGVYCVYLALALFGMPQAVEGCASFLESGADCCGAAILKYPQFHTVLTYSKVSNTAIQSEIQGEHGFVSLGSVSKLHEFTLSLNNRQPEPFSYQDGAVTRMGPELQDFLDIIGQAPGFQDTYSRLCQLSYQAGCVLDAIRGHAGIRFESYVPVIQ